MSIRRVGVTLVSVALVGLVSFCYDRAFLPKDAPVVRQDRKPATSDATSDGEETTDSLQRVAPQLLQLFPDENDWRRKGANVVFPPGRECVFLFRGAPSLSHDGKTVSLNACTLVLLAKASGRVSEDERFRRAVVLESTDKLELTFANSFADLSKLEGGQFDFTSFEYGKMSGSVVVRSQMESPGPEDDLYFKTREVVFNMTQIHTNFDVSFYFGRNGGSGKGLTIDLDAPLRFSSNRLREEQEQDAAQTPTVETTDDPVELAEQFVDDGNLGAGFSLKGIQLTDLSGYFRYYYKSAVANEDVREGTDEQNADEQNADEETDATQDDEYVEIRGKKGLYFSSNPNVVGGWCVRFNRDVELIAYDREGMKAQLLCDSLYLYLQDKTLEELGARSEEARNVLARRKVTGNLTRLVPTTVRAIGGASSPALVKMPKNAQEISADEFVYDLQTNRLDLRSATPDEAVCISCNSDAQFIDFRSNLIQVQLSDDNQFQSVYAGKSGVLNTLVNDERKIGRSLSVTWEDGLQVVPTEELPNVLQMTSSGAVSFKLEDVGTFSATEANFWFKLESDATEDDERQDLESRSQLALLKKTAFTPVCADFRKDVEFQAPRGCARIADSVVVRFGKANGAARDELENRPTNEDEETSFFSDSFSNEEERSRFEILGQKLELDCVLQDQGAEKLRVEVDKIAALGGFSLIERANVDGSEKMCLVAEKARIRKPGAADMSIELEGAIERPAYFKTKELALSGERVVVDRPANRFQVVGDGNLELEPPKRPVSQNHEPNAAHEPANVWSEEKITVAWSDSMVFDGQTLSFKAKENDDVRIIQGAQKLLCPEARLTLKKPVSIFELNFNKKDDGLDVEYVQCFGSLEHLIKVEISPQGSDDARPATFASDSYCQASFQNLQYQRSTGEFVVKNGGEFRAVSPAKQNPFKALELPNAKNGSTNDATDESSATDVLKPSWLCAHMKFQGELRGKLARREMEAANGVRAALAVTNDPNVRIDVDRRDSLPEDYATVSSKSALVKFDDKTNGSAKNAIEGLEVEARGNVVFRQKDIVGLCDTMRFVSKKNLVILSGSETQKASVFQQAGEGAQRKLLGEFMRALYKIDTQALDVESFTRLDD